MVHRATKLWPGQSTGRTPVSPCHNENVADSIRERVLTGASDANIRFSDLRAMLLKLGFEERVNGSHHIFTRQDVAEILNLQPRNSMAKSYQVKQVRGVLVRYKLVEGAR